MRMSFIIIPSKGSGSNSFGWIAVPSQMPTGYHYPSETASSSSSKRLSPKLKLIEELSGISLERLNGFALVGIES